MKYVVNGGDRTMKRRAATAALCQIAAALVLVASCLLLTGVTLVVDPYAGVDWAHTEQHQGNLHTHTTQSDGHLTPSQVVDEYRARGYTILGLTDHSLCTWPWTEFGTMERKGRAVAGDRAAERGESGKDVKLDREGKPRRPPAPSVPAYEDRVPDALGMLAVAGNEVSVHEHTCCLFAPFETTSRSVDQTLTELAAVGGLAVLNHPGRYWEPNEAGEVPADVVERYVTWLREHDNALGLEVINQGFRYKHDFELWDLVLGEMMPSRPVWGYANDDMHDPVTLGRDSSMFLLPGLTEENLREAMKGGRSYIRSVSTHDRAERDMKETPIIQSITHDAAAGTITIAAISGGKPLPEDRYQWIAGGKVVHTGPTLDYQHTEGIGAYVRAELRGDGGTAYTNPFGFSKS